MKTKKIYTLMIILSTCLISCANAQNVRQDVIQERGGHVKVVQYADGSWQLKVDEKDYFIKGVVFAPVKIGEAAANSTMRDWMNYDDNQNGKNDIAFDTWVDENSNNKKDAQEKPIGDFALMKSMGVNTIRLYHVASDHQILGDIYKQNQSTASQFDHPVNKELLRTLYNDYGIMVIIGNFLGSWTIGAGTSWAEGTDYTNAKHREQIKKSVKAMILDNKDEPYVLMWALGNENNIAQWSKCNAYQQPAAYAKLVGELVDMIHEMDPEHPVAVVDGDNFNTLREYVKYAPEIDIIGFNSYRGNDGFGDLWRRTKKLLDRPVFISEYGIFAYNTKNGGEDENLQLNYTKNAWKDIELNNAANFNKAAQTKGIGNSLGGTIFAWSDRWDKDGHPHQHNAGTMGWMSPDGLLHHEWFGLVSMGDGADPLLRQKRKAFNYLQSIWTSPE